MVIPDRPSRNIHFNFALARCNSTAKYGKRLIARALNEAANVSVENCINLLVYCLCHHVLLLHVHTAYLPHRPLSYTQRKRALDADLWVAAQCKFEMC